MATQVKTQVPQTEERKLPWVSCDGSPGYTRGLLGPILAEAPTARWG